ncbi:MAG: hypothetical protein JWM53_6706 [bacterium]|nr:hypothetical protein [bacterium]
MDYYAAWPTWKMPKWLGATLGGIFSVIAGGSIWLIVDLTRPPRHPAVTVVAAPVAAAPVAAALKLAEPARPAAALAPATPEKATVAVAKKAHDLSPAHKRAILAKHDSKATRRTKTEADFDRLLGL